MDLTGEYPNDPDMKQVQLGLDVMHFTTYDKVGIYLIERAHQDRVAALEDLVNVDPNDTAEVRRLQWQAKIPEMFLAWLEQAIDAAVNAEIKIAEEEVYDGEA